MTWSTVGDKFPARLLQDNALQLWDHIDGFDSNGNNQILSALPPQEIHIEYLLPDWVKQKYPQHTIKFDANLMIKNNHFKNALAYIDPLPPAKINNFLCCFNRSVDYGRKRLTEALILKGWFDPNYCSKWFNLPAHKFNNNSKRSKIATTVVAHEVDTRQTDFQSNLAALSPMINASFLNVVSETIATSYIPFPTEKFLFPILQQRLWVAYAQPCYHGFISKVLGFRLYDDLFDYSFDTIVDPFDRLTALLDSLESYSTLTKHAWTGIYKQLAPTIEYNYHWATSGQFINKLLELDEAKQNPAYYENYKWENKLKNCVLPD